MKQKNSRLQVRASKQEANVTAHPSGREKRSEVTGSRLAAFEILMAVRAGRGHSDELLHAGRLDALSREDRNFTTALVLGVLRWQIALDAMVKKLLDRPEQRLAEEVAVVLEMGTFQLRYMDRIPAHAALSESVELCRVAGHPHAAGMVNGVLRKVAGMKPREAIPIFEAVAAYSERMGHPHWMVQRWAERYGREAAWIICEADQREPLHHSLFEQEPELPIMDDGSRLVAELACAALPEARRVWDCCAAPGGKTLVLARRLADAEILASDISAKRVAKMEVRLKRYGYGARVQCGVADAAGLDSGRQFDLVLCDVPCSGTGTLAENPEIRHRLKHEELRRQSARQISILRKALTRVAPGGRLLYSTCSLEPEECDEVVSAVLADVPWRKVELSGLVERLKVQKLLRAGIDLSGALQGNQLRTIPGVHPCAGFYACVLERA